MRTAANNLIKSTLIRRQIRYRFTSNKLSLTHCLTRNSAKICSNYLLKMFLRNVTNQFLVTNFFEK